MPDPSPLIQLLWLFVLPGVVACVSWTVTHEQLFEEARDWCHRQSENARRPWYVRTWFYLFTCEYCFSHYVAAFFLVVTRFQMLYEGWRGYLIAWFALVWVANVYMSFFNRLRLDIKHENVTIATDQMVQQKVDSQP
jgi:hypothetical protein